MTRVAVHVHGAPCADEPDPEAEFRTNLLLVLSDLGETLTRIAIALETGPRVPASMSLIVRPITKE